MSASRVFEQGSAERLKFFQICHSMLVTLFADKCGDEMDRLDPLLDDPAFIDRLYNDQPILRDGQPVARPSNPSLASHFNDLKFGILDRRTKVFFRIYPFFAR
jgi:hypothetical protein